MPRLLAFALACALLGCSAGAGRAAEQLARASRDTHDALRFGDYDVVSRYLPFDQRTAFMSRAYGVEKKLSILDFQTVSTELSPDGDRAIVVSRLSWYELPSTVVKTDSVFFEWRREGVDPSRDGTWTLVRISGGPLPVEMEEETGSEADAPRAGDP